MYLKPALTKLPMQQSSQLRELETELSELWELRNKVEKQATSLLKEYHKLLLELNQIDTPKVKFLLDLVRKRKNITFNSYLEVKIKLEQIIEKKEKVTLELASLLVQVKNEARNIEQRKMLACLFRVHLGG